MIARSERLETIRSRLETNPVVAVLGPRQCGKTTLARMLMPTEAASYFDLEDPVVAEIFADPMTALRDLRGLVIIDEAQQRPELFPVLRVLSDRPDRPATFLILGSASPELSRQASESLAGRVSLIEMTGFSTGEIPTKEWPVLWRRGGFPRSFLAGSEEESSRWRSDFIQTFLQRDLRSLGFGMSPQSMGRFWTMLSHYHGGIWNASETANALGLAVNTVRSYLDALVETYMVRRLPPWFENVGKRLVKSPKIYIRDSGLFHSLQRIESSADLLTHPKIGSSWEGFVLENLISQWKIEDPYYYAVHSGAELDLFFMRHGRRYGVEIKRTDAPRPKKGYPILIEDLGLEHLYIVYPGDRSYPIREGVTALPFGSAIPSP
jgi:predicted AAA+ superfamily ATPase